MILKVSTKFLILLLYLYLIYSNMLKCHLLKLSAAFKCLRQELISANGQTVWPQIRLLLEEQSDLGPHCLL